MRSGVRRACEGFAAQVGSTSGVGTHGMDVQGEGLVPTAAVSSRPPSLDMRWCMETAYGDSATVPPVDELGRYLRWALEMRERARWERTL